VIPRITPRILVARSCWEVITGELDRVAPAEGVLLPLVALDRRSPDADPCAPVGLRELAAVVLAEVRCLPPHLQHNGLARVAALPSADAWADGVVLPLVRRAPRLRAAAYLHSHPFAIGHTWPSAGDVEGHMIPLWRRNAEAGLDASFSFIACAAGGGGWRLPCFALGGDARGRVVELGAAEVVDDDHDAIRRARAPRASRCLLRRWRHQLHRRGLALRADELFDGWSRVRVRLGAHRVLVALFPVDFPGAPPRYHLVDLRTRASRRLDLAFSADAAEVLRAEAA
jgi:hypothetical protein